MKRNASIIGEISSIIEKTSRKFQVQQIQSQGLTCLEFQKTRSYKLNEQAQILQ